MIGDGQPGGLHRCLILIGGSEDKQGARVILREVARRAGHGRLVVATLGSEEPEQQWQRYAQVFRELGVEDIEHLSVISREDAMGADPVALLRRAGAVFFTGGDQVKITTKMGGTPLYGAVRDLYDRGGLIAGTSAGASAMGEAMLVSNGRHDDAHKVRGAFYMTRGLGLVRDMIIDQHFAQRARIERLIAAVAENPAVLGLGIDEDTGVILEGTDRLFVMGSGAVYVADGHGVTYSNMSEQASGRTLCLFDVRLHVLCHSAGFDLKTRKPFLVSAPGQVERDAPGGAVDPPRSTPGRSRRGDAD